MSRTPISRSVLLFDLDGTVLDTKDLIIASYHYACDQVLGYRLPDEPLLEMVGVPLPEQMYKLAPEEHAEAMVKAYRQHNAEAHDRYINYFPKTRETLETFAEAGWRMAIVTSKRNESARQGLDSFALAGYFEMIIGFDDTDKHKPDPTPLLLAAERFAVQTADCVYIGDSPYDMQAATAAEIYAVGATWGFFTPERLLEAGAKLLVDKIADLPAALSFIQLKR